jgi:MFS transporter, DHA1 family, multidrug resistance protein
MMKKSRVFSSLRASAYASLALTFASFGDAFLYPFLPSNSAQVGVPIVWVGVLLSINRIVRIFSNGLMVSLFARYGMRSVMISAVLLAIFSTLGYGLTATVWLWVVLRVGWGLSFSAMRIGTLGYAIKSENQGTALGVSRALQEIGPTITLFFAPLLLYYFSPSQIFFLLAGFSVPAVFFAWNLPKDRVRTTQSSVMRELHWPSAPNSITFLLALLIDGIVVVVLGVLFVKHGAGINAFAATALAAFYLGYRRICLVALSPAGGWLGDRLGLDKLFNVSVSMIVIGLIIMISGWVAIGSVIVFTFYSVNAAVTPGSIAKDPNNPLLSVAENATWRDLGAAIGTLAGGLLIASPYLSITMLITIFGLAFLLLVHMGTARKALNLFYAWK